jgi:uncharacterized spore protein YtfJ
MACMAKMKQLATIIEELQELFPDNTIICHIDEENDEDVLIAISVIR